MKEHEIDIDTKPSSSYFDAVRLLLEAPIWRLVQTGEDVRPQRLVLYMPDGERVIYRHGSAE